MCFNEPLTCANLDCYMHLWPKMKSMRNEDDKQDGVPASWAEQHTTLCALPSSRKIVTVF